MEDKTSDTQQGVLYKNIAPEIKKVMEKDNLNLKPDDKVSLDDLLNYRLKVIENQLHKSNEFIKSNDKKILKSIRDNEFITQQLKDEKKEKLTLGQRTADGIAKFGGSWIFIFSFIAVLLIWISINSVLLFFKPFDPYPFILLNLVLSCLAAIQAPIIMMSQNRQAEHDRVESEHDYQVNLKAEIEVRLLHEKMDHLIFNEMKQLQDIQEVQVDMLKNLEEEIKEVRDMKNQKN